jgi:hypothetical protein
MGTGTEVAIQSAGITLVKGDLAGIARAIVLSRATMRNIRQNLVFAFAYNAIGIPIAAGVLYPASAFCSARSSPRWRCRSAPFRSSLNALRLRSIGGLVPTLKLLSLAGIVISALQYWLGKPAQQPASQEAMPVAASGNPLELGAAAIFAALFVLTSVVSALAKSEFGISGIYALAAIIGVTDIDPFVLNLVQGGVAGVQDPALAAAILIAASSNNVLKALYAAFFAGGRATAASAAALVVLALAGVAAAVAIAMLGS